MTAEEGLWAKFSRSGLTPPVAWVYVGGINDIHLITLLHSFVDELYAAQDTFQPTNFLCYVIYELFKESKLFSATQAGIAATCME
jgi:hypothetical protein